MYIVSEDEYLQVRGYGALSDYTLDTCKLPHGETQRQRQRRLKQADLAITAFYSEKQKKRQEYRDKVKNGELRPPTPLEERVRTAHGPEEKQQTQAARRMLKKCGIDWTTTIPYTKIQTLEVN